MRGEAGPAHAGAGAAIRQDIACTLILIKCAVKMISYILWNYLVLITSRWDALFAPRAPEQKEMLCEQE